MENRHHQHNPFWSQTPAKYFIQDITQMIINPEKSVTPR